MIAKLATLCKISSRCQAAKIPEIMDKMRLIEVSTGQCNIGPPDRPTLFNQAQHLLKTSDTIELFGGQSNSLIEYLNKVSCTEACLLNDFRDRPCMRKGLKFSKRKGNCGPPEQRSAY